MRIKTSENYEKEQSQKECKSKKKWKVEKHCTGWVNDKYRSFKEY